MPYLSSENIEQKDKPKVYTRQSYFLTYCTPNVTNLRFFNLGQTMKL